MAETIDKVKRKHIADYLNTGTTATPVWSFMGAGFDTLDENPNAQKESKIYINDDSASTTIKSYEPTFPFNSELIKSEAAVMALYKVGRDQLTGTAAEKEYIRVELFEPIEGEANAYKARKFRVSVEVSSLGGKGGEPISVAGNLNNVGSFVEGEFDTSTKTFTASV